MVQILETEIDEAQGRVEEQDDCDTTGEHHEEIVRKWKKLQTLQRLAQRTESLCKEERIRCTTQRTQSPYDTEPAIQSRYAWVFDLRGQTPVSPMRGVSQPADLWSAALDEVMKI
jgi:hypothetical protein